MKKVILFTAILFFTYYSFSQIRVIKPIANTPANSTSCCGFRAYNSTELPMGAGFGKESKIVFDKELFDDGNAFQGAYYKAPSDGVYQFNLQLGIKGTNTDAEPAQVVVKISTNNNQSNTQLLYIPAKYDGNLTTESTALFKLKTGEEVSVILIGTSSAKAITTGNLSYFSGVKLY